MYTQYVTGEFYRTDYCHVLNLGGYPVGFKESQMNKVR